MHYIRELVHDRTIILQYCPTDEQIADIFTKSFSEKKFTYLRSLFGVSSSG
jgi:KUP system potassium uptake protein